MTEIDLGLVSLINGGILQGRGCGQVVIALAYCSQDPSLNLADY